jgi:hypothetical protein
VTLKALALFAHAYPLQDWAGFGGPHILFVALLNPGVDCNAQKEHQGATTDQYRQTDKPKIPTADRIVRVGNSECFAK